MGRREEGAEALTSSGTGEAGGEKAWQMERIRRREVDA